MNVAGDLFLCGGATRTEYDRQTKPGVASIANVDVYNAKLDRWEKFATFKQRRHGAAVAAIGGYLTAVLAAAIAARRFTRGLAGLGPWFPTGGNEMVALSPLKGMRWWPHTLLKWNEATSGA